MVVMNCEQISSLEKKAVENGDSFLRLMQNAGKSVYDFICENLSKHTNKVVILSGKGNNGGDGFVLAELLSDSGISVEIILTGGEPSTDIARFYFNRVQERHIPIYYFDGISWSSKNILYQKLNSATLIVDAIFGIGFRGEIQENLTDLFCNMNFSSAIKLSIDVPSGLSCDGGIPGDLFVEADYTVTFSALKPVCVLYPTSDYCGKTVVKDVGIDKNLIYRSDNVMKVIDKNMFRNILKPRKRSANKGDFGRLLCICGKYGMAGACIFSAKSAVRCGVGLADIALVKSIYPIVASKLCEPVFTVLEETEKGTIAKTNIPVIEQKLKLSKACLIGCGMGVDSDTEEILKFVVGSSEIPLIIDADAINILAKDISVIKRAKTQIVLTPHPGEMARLVNKTPEEVQINRLSIAKSFATEHKVYLVLKGANTLIAMPNGEVFVNLTGNPGMARGGSGDVLAGMISSFIAQGFSVWESILGAVFIHGAVGDSCAEKYSETAMTPSNMIDELPEFFKSFKTD